MRSRTSCMVSHMNLLSLLLEWNAVFVVREPHVERLQIRIERSADAQTARTEVIGLKVPLELKHVGEVVRAGKAQLGIVSRLDCIVAHLLPESPSECSSHLGTRQMLAGDSDCLADEFAASLEDPQRAL